MTPLPEWERRLYFRDGQVIVAAHEHRERVYFTKHKLRDAPNDYVTIEDLKKFGILEIGADVSAVA